MKLIRMNEDVLEPAANVPTPRVGRNWTIKTKYDSDMDAYHISRFDCTYKGVENLGVIFEITSWFHNELPDERDNAVMLAKHNNPDFKVSIWAGNMADTPGIRAVPDDPDCSKSSDIIRRILTGLENDFDDILEAVDNPADALNCMTDSRRTSRDLATTIKKAFSTTSRIIDRLTVDQDSVL